MFAEVLRQSHICAPKVKSFCVCNKMFQPLQGGGGYYSPPDQRKWEKDFDLDQCVCKAAGHEPKRVLLMRITFDPKSTYLYFSTNDCCFFFR